MFPTPNPAIGSSPCPSPLASRSWMLPLGSISIALRLVYPSTNRASFPNFCPKAFGQKFGKEARLVDGYTNLSAMEIDPNGSIQDLLASGEGQGDDPMAGLGVGNMMQDLAFSVCFFSRTTERPCRASTNQCRSICID